MAKVGRFVTDPRVGAYCHITLDSGEKLVVSHDKGGFKRGMLTIEATRLLGLRSERVFSCDLDAAAGQAALAHLTRGVQPDAVEATPLAAFVNHVKHCRSVAEAKVHCAALMSSGPST